MSKTLGSIENSGSRGVELDIVKYWGGDKHGVCIQLTGKMEDGKIGYVQLREN